MKERLSKLLNEPVIDIQKIFGEASTRVYHRLFLQNKKTFVLMEMPKGKKMSASEEITNLKSEVGSRKSEIPYVNIQRYLKQIGLPVPEIISFDKDEAQIVLEDLGDTKLENVVKNAGAKELIDWYKRAIDLLVELQTKTTSDLRTPCIAFQRSFDATLFNWEFDHFWEYYFKIKNQK